MCLGFQVLRGVRARTVSASEAAEKFEPATTPATQHSETGSDTWTAVPCSEAEAWEFLSQDGFVSQAIVICFTSAY
jgi:hypothetical protein